jgi:hypothetical protein
MGRIRLAGGVLGILLATSGCSAATQPTTFPTMPATTTITAVFLDAGKPTVLLHPCPGSVVNEVTLTDLTLESPSSPGHIWSVADTGVEHPVSQFTLLDTPAGWHLQPVQGMDPIIEFQPSHQYWAIANTNSALGTRIDPGVKFRLSDLAALADGQVWAATTPLHPRSMTRDEFVRGAESHC